MGDALEVLPQIKGPYDLVFIDADKENYFAYFDAVLPKMRKGGLIISDNVMWSGKVLHNTKPKDKATSVLKDYNKAIKVKLNKNFLNIFVFFGKSNNKLNKIIF